MFYDSVTTRIRQNYGEFGGFGWIRLGLYEYGKIQLRYTKMFWEIRHESVKNTLKEFTNQVRIKGNLWQFLTIREIFSLK